MSDLTGFGDTFRTNAMLDNVLVTYGANCDKRAALYTNGRDVKDPMLSPLFGDMHGFPPQQFLQAAPVIFCSATRYACTASYGKPASKRCCKSLKASLTPNITAT